MRLEDAADRPLRAAALVVLSRVDVIDAGVEGRSKDVVVAERPAADADIGDLEARPAEPPVVLDPGPRGLGLSVLFIVAPPVIFERAPASYDVLGAKSMPRPFPGARTGRVKELDERL
ncbi:MAG: hypothetical protein MUE80_08165 [Acidobacteria bacterium]|nr:hypothetical protein [Acidobacteriota bacterium]